MRPGGFHAIAALLLLMLAAPPALAGFYDVVPGELAGRPGSIIRAEVIDIGTPGSSAFRILYRSTGLDGKPIAVSGVVIRPEGHTPPGGRPIAAWAHPTTGVARHCAPSLVPNVISKVPGVTKLLDHGYVVVATDYPGLGTAGVHPYLIGVSEGRAVLDSVRAARAIEEIGAGDRFAVWGHSQGGHAVLYSGELAKSYAPELKLVGLAAAAPATELAELFEDDLSSLGGRILTAMGLWSWSKVYSGPLAPVVEEAAMAAFEQVAKDCLGSLGRDIGELEAQKPLKQRFLKIDPVKTDPWHKILVANSPGRSPAGAPVFIAQGLADTTVDPPVTVGFVQLLCRQGIPVRFVRFPGVKHGEIAKKSADMAVEWIVERFKGAPAPNNCGE